ncbi:hypothetical protein SEPL_221 [Salmonella phage SE_PL]|uniref:hypothetical protein n=1 Tax=Salmonella enterica TaxID=28901 RepID=UPI000FDF70F1|nr:hypothetical protein CPT_Munch_205 [Salmonella phage Munch]EHX8550444.1 hypothetical protein [Salmonella enterica]MCP0435771.1 hypothetical protein [Salmonella enterica subsp. enterica serovar Mbandaka]QCW18891.1 hypothetical protein 7t3_0370 [Salmonella phage 7t3]QIG62834.1 hypothetical protein SEPL_221 [Salmonella phage SE_PL]WNV47313.1 hypothetical protein [Klebsiella phage fENko-Kae01]
MNSKESFKYAFAIILAAFGGYGFIAGNPQWFWWLIASLGYLTGTAFYKILMD